MNFVKTVLDQQSFGHEGPTGKSDFLKGRTLSDLVKFLNRSAFDELIYNLACLLGVRYTRAPTEQERQLVENIRIGVAHNPSLLESYQEHNSVNLFDERKAMLENHRGVIAIFDKALLKPNWPEDRPVRQIFETIEAHTTIKTGWRTSLFTVV
jgi:hypothetical protein